MTEKELRKLKRSELLETVQAENESLKQKLEKAEGGISSENLDKIISAVKSAAEEYFRGQSGDKAVADNGSNEKDAKINKDGRQRAGKQKNG